MNRIAAYITGLINAFIGGERLLVNAVAGLEKLTDKLQTASAQIGEEINSSFEVTDALTEKLTAEYDRREGLYHAQDRAVRVKYNVEKLLGVNQDDAEENDPFGY